MKIAEIPLSPEKKNQSVQLHVLIWKEPFRKVVAQIAARGICAGQSFSYTAFALFVDQEFSALQLNPSNHPNCSGNNVGNRTANLSHHLLSNRCHRTLNFNNLVKNDSQWQILLPALIQHP